MQPDKRERHLVRWRWGCRGGGAATSQFELDGNRFSPTRCVAVGFIFFLFPFQTHLIVQLSIVSFFSPLAAKSKAPSRRSAAPRSQTSSSHVSKPGGGTLIDGTQRAAPLTVSTASLWLFLGRAQEVPPLPDRHDELQHHRGEPPLRPGGGVCRRGRCVRQPLIVTAAACGSINSLMSPLEGGVEGGGQIQGPFCVSRNAEFIRLRGFG